MRVRDGLLPGPTRASGGGGRARVARALLAGSLVGALVCGLTGCATEEGGVPGELSRAARDAASATASGELAVDLLLRGRTTATVTDVALADMLAHAQDAEVAAATLVVGTGQERDLRAQTLTTLHDGTTALVRARSWVATEVTGDEATGDAVAADGTARREVLAEVARRLSDLADRLEAGS